MRVAIKKKIASLLVFIMIFTSFVPVYAAPNKNKSKNDIEGHWAETDILAMASNGVMGGYPDGSMKPNRYVTIAETVKMINKAFNIVGAGDLYSIPYTDVSPYEWYSSDIALAVENGYLLSIAPGKRLKPNAPATREQIGAMFAQVMGLESKTLDPVSKFSDYGKITQGYNYYFAAAVKEGLFAGYPDNTLRPQATVTRGIMAAVSNRAMSQSQTTELHKIFVGPNDVLIETPGTTISNRIVDNVWVAASVGEGNVTLDNVKVRGKLVIKGGGPNSVIVKGESDVPLVYMEKETRDLRLKVEKPAIVGTVNVNAGSKNYVTGEIETLIPNVKRGEVRVDKAKIKTIEVKGEDSDLYVDKDSEITNLTVNRSASNSFMSLDGKITSVVISAPITKAQVYGKVNSIFLTSTARASEIIAEKSSQITTVKTDADRVSIRGTGKVDNAIINGNDCKIDTVPTKVEVDKNASGTTSNGKPITGGSSGTTQPGGGIGGGTVGPNDPNAKVTTMEVTKYPPTEKLVYTVGDTLNLDGLEVTFSYSNGATASVPLKDFAANSISVNPNPNGSTKVLANTKSVKITHLPTNKSATLNLTVNPIPKVKELMIMKTPKTTYADGELLDLTGMEVLLRYDNEATKTVKFEKTKVTVDGLEKDSDSFKDVGIETAILNGVPLTLKRPGTVQETKTITVSFRNPGNQIIKTQDPLYVIINPTDRVSAISIVSYKTSYIFGEKFNFGDLVIRLINSNPDKGYIELKYDNVEGSPTKNEFVYNDNYIVDGVTHNKGEKYKEVAQSNGDILKEVKITEEINGKDILVTDGMVVGLGGSDNKKKLKISHIAKDLSPVPVDMVVEIKPPSKAVRVIVTGLATQYDENTTAAASLGNLDIKIIRDSIVSQNPGDSTQEFVNVLYGTKDGVTGLWEYTNRADSNTWTPYNRYEPGNKRILDIKVVNSSGGENDMLTHTWRRDDKVIQFIHSESGVKLDANGGTVNTEYNNVKLSEVQITVKPSSGIERLEMLKDPTKEEFAGKPQKDRLFYVDDILQKYMVKYKNSGNEDNSGVRILVKEYNKPTRYFEYMNDGGYKWVEFDSKFVDKIAITDGFDEKINMVAVWKNGEEKPITSKLTTYFDGATIKISIDDGSASKPTISSGGLKIAKINSIRVQGIAPKDPLVEDLDINPVIQKNDYASAGKIYWTPDVYQEGIGYEAVVIITPKKTTLPDSSTVSYVFDQNITSAGNIQVDGMIPNSISEVQILENKDLFFKVKFAAPGIQTLSAPIAPATKMLAAPEPTLETFSYTEPTNAKIVSTATDFYSALSNTQVSAIKIAKNTTLSKDTVITKPIIVEDGVTLSFNADDPALGRHSGLGEKRFKTTRQFRITGKGVVYVKTGAVLNKIGSGNYKMDNGGKIILEGTLGISGTKWIGKEGSTLKTYGKSTIIITGSMAGPTMTIQGKADVLQSLTLDHNLIVSENATLNIKKGKSLKANTNITINNKGNINIEENSNISGTGKYVGESPMGNFFAGFIIEGDESVRYGSKKTSLKQSQNGSDVRISFNVPYETSMVSFNNVFVNAGDVKPGSYTLKGKEGIKSVMLLIDPPSSKTGLSKVNLGEVGIEIPSNISPGRYTVSGIIGGANVTLDIYID